MMSKEQNEALKHVFSYLDKKDLAMVSLVNKQWKKVANNDLLWKNLAISYFPSAKKQILTTNNPKEIFRNTLIKEGKIKNLYYSYLQQDTLPTRAKLMTEYFQINLFLIGFYNAITRSYALHGKTAMEGFSDSQYLVGFILMLASVIPGFISVYRENKKQFSTHGDIKQTWNIPREEPKSQENKL